ncbi:MAG: hypothetical protein ACK6DA_03310, partial [Candidatus Kapaibacterium sp.]
FNQPLDSTIGSHLEQIAGMLNTVEPLSEQNNPAINEQEQTPVQVVLKCPHLMCASKSKFKSIAKLRLHVKNVHDETGSKPLTKQQLIDIGFRKCQFCSLPYVCTLDHETTCTYRSVNVELTNQELRAILTQELENLKGPEDMIIGTEFLDNIGWEDIIGQVVTTCAEIPAPTIIKKAMVVIYSHHTNMFILKLHTMNLTRLEH